MVGKRKGTSISKRRKCHGKGKKDEDVEFMERLPEAILCHVLSFLPTQEAVRTCVLSKRWRYVWTFVPSIEIDDESLFSGGCAKSPNPKAALIKFVDRLLYLHNVSCLRIFHLYCSNADYASSRVTNWIDTVIMPDLLEELDLFFWGSRPVKLPRTLFTLKKLVILKLQTNVHLDVLTPSISFPSLKILSLGYLDLFSRGYTKNLLDGCPVLEHLDILNEVVVPKHGDGSTLLIRSSSLKSLRVHLRCMLAPRKVINLVLDAINLERLDLFYHPSIQYDMTTGLSLSSLVEVKLGFCNNCLARFVQTADRLVKIMSKFSTTKYLSLKSCAIIEHLETCLHNVPMFDNLTHLDLRTLDYSGQVLSVLLECSPSLITLVVHKEKSCPEPMQFQAPKCLKNLEEIKLTGFRGCKDELEVVSYFLKNATILKKMSINSYYTSSKKHSEITKKLLMLPRSSISCQIAFY